MLLPAANVRLTHQRGKRFVIKLRAFSTVRVHKRGRSKAHYAEEARIIYVAGQNEMALQPLAAGHTRGEAHTGHKDDACLLWDDLDRSTTLDDVTQLFERGAYRRSFAFEVSIERKAAA